MKLIRYTSKFSTRVVLLVETGRKLTKIITLDMPPRIIKVANEQARFMRDIPESFYNSPEKFLFKLREKYLTSKQGTISHEIRALLNLENTQLGFENEQQNEEIMNY